jgi:hypothetical protein
MNATMSQVRMTVLSHPGTGASYLFGSQSHIHYILYMYIRLRTERIRGPCDPGILIVDYSEIYD